MNKAFQKRAEVTDYYDPEKPAVNVKESVIQQLQLTQQRDYDKIRFEELTAKVKELEDERLSLLRWKYKASKVIKSQHTEL